MFRKSSLRIRYLVSYLLLLATVVVFITVLYQIYMNTNERYINAASLEKFTYASENICTLLDKPERRVIDVKVDYTGFEIPDEFVVGFGLDYDQKYRNLPYIGVVEFDGDEEK